MINYTIPDIITYFQTNYGQIIEQELNDKEDIVKLTIYDPTLPIDTVFNQIKAFQDLCIITGNEKINPSFHRCSKQWNVKTELQKTFVNLSIHMCQEYYVLCEVGVILIRDSEFTSKHTENIHIFGVGDEEQ